MAEPIVLPTRNGTVELSEYAGTARCVTGCRTMGGGLLLAQVRGDEGENRGAMVFCGNCLATALVRQIDAVQGGHEERSDR